MPSAALAIKVTRHVIPNSIRLRFHAIFRASMLCFRAAAILMPCLRYDVDVAAFRRHFFRHYC